MNLFNKFVKEAVANNQALASIEDALKKELFHFDILLTLNENDLLKDLVFFGGTCLRRCYRSTRLSEDLDFKSKIPLDLVTMKELKVLLKKHFITKYGFDIQITDPKEKKEGNTKTWKISIITKKATKTNIYRSLIHLDICSLKAYDTKFMPLQNPYDVSVGTKGIILQAQSMEEIFTDKIIAFALRNKIKYRDIWDMTWLHTKNITPNMSLIPEKLDAFNSHLMLFSERFNGNIMRLQLLYEEFKKEMQRFLPSNDIAFHDKNFWEATLYAMGEVQKGVMAVIKKELSQTTKVQQIDIKKLCTPKTFATLSMAQQKKCIDTLIKLCNKRGGADYLSHLLKVLQYDATLQLLSFDALCKNPPEHEMSHQLSSALHFTLSRINMRYVDIKSLKNSIKQLLSRANMAGSVTKAQSKHAVCVFITTAFLKKDISDDLKTFLLKELAKSIDLFWHEYQNDDSHIFDVAKTVTTKPWLQGALTFLHILKKHEDRNPLANARFANKCKNIINDCLDSSYYHNLLAVTYGAPIELVASSLDDFINMLRDNIPAILRDHTKDLFMMKEIAIGSKEQAEAKKIGQALSVHIRGTLYAKVANIKKNSPSYMSPFLQGLIGK